MESLLRDIRSHLVRDCLSIVLDYALDFDEQIRELKRKLYWTRAAKERHALTLMMKTTRLVSIHECAEAVWNALQRYTQTQCFRRKRRTKEAFTVCTVQREQENERPYELKWYGPHDGYGLRRGSVGLYHLGAHALKRLLLTFGDQCYPLDDGKASEIEASEASEASDTSR